MLGIALVNLAVFAAGCTLAIVRTRDERRRFLFTFFKELRRDPERSFRIDPRQLGDRHVQWAFKRWVERGLAPATIQTYLSFLRVFELWIGKPGMVKSAEV